MRSTTDNVQRSVRNVPWFSPESVIGQGFCSACLESWQMEWHSDRQRSRRGPGPSRAENKATALAPSQHRQVLWLNAAAEHFAELGLYATC